MLCEVPGVGSAFLRGSGSAGGGPGANHLDSVPTSGSRKSLLPCLLLPVPSPNIMWPREQENS